MPSRIFIATLLFTLVGATSFLPGSELRLASPFTDGAILQRKAEIPVWGWSNPGQKVFVEFKGETVSTEADADGIWSLKLPPTEASTEPETLTASVDGQAPVTISDILVGEVWLCSGQSNMAMPVQRSDNAEAEIAAADLPGLRVFTVGRKPSLKPLDECDGGWIASTPETAGRFSAVAYFYGRELHRELDVPVGLIVAAWSGSAIEAWTSRKVQENTPELRPLLESWEKKDAAYTPEIAAAEKADYIAKFTEWKTRRDVAIKAGEYPPRAPRRPVDPRDHHHHPAVLFNGMISPLIPYGIRGVIWYQGETNGLTSESAALYATQLPLLVTDWRHRWGQGDFPMAWMQLPTVSAQQVEWAPVREAMRLAQRDLPNTGMAVTLDIGQERLLHPTNKQDFAHRLALWARSDVYGDEIEWSGPLPKSHKFGPNKIAVDFSHAGRGLSPRDGKRLAGFELRNAEGNWHSARAGIRDAKIIAVSDEVSEPTAIRYAWGNDPEGNLVNGEGLPASPFLIEKKGNPGKTTRSNTPPPSKPPLDPVEISELPEPFERLDIFLLMGQSNMKGRGVMPEEPLRDPQIVMMHKGTDRWFLARHPLHLVGNPETFEGHDNAGVGSGLAFAQTVAEARPETRIALIPCAVGGTAISKWARGQRLYEESIRRAKLARTQGPEGKTRIAGALWLQGEADSQEARVPVYGEKLNELVDNLRADLGIEELPFIPGTIGEMREPEEMRKAINEILLDLPNNRPNTAAVDARDLKGHVGDSVHFDTDTQNEIGRRFAEKWLDLDAK